MKKKALQKKLKTFVVLNGVWRANEFVKLLMLFEFIKSFEKTILYQVSENYMHYVNKM